MSYAIIGSGKVGSALARQFSRAQIPVAVANRRGPTSLQPLSEELGPVVTAMTINAALEAEVLLLAIPFAAVEALGGQRSDWSGKLVIDATNAYGVTPEYMAGRLSSDIVAAAFPGAATVKAFNQLPAAVLARDPALENGRRVVFVASNDEKATFEVKALVERLGFSPIVVGRIDEGGRLLHISGPLVLRNLVEYPFK